MGMKCARSSEEGEGEPTANQMVKEGFKTMMGKTPENGSFVSV